MDFKKTEKKWQEIWEKEQPFKAQTFSDKPKYYALDMFPYPSGVGLHIGHIASYTPTDIISRYKRAKGFNVLHPIGYDAFGLPAEQYAIKTGVHPAETTKKAIDNFRRQLKTFGFSYDWSREISTCEPSYYKWTQFIFLKLYEKGLAYQKQVSVNWCPALKTVLANEEVINGKSERGGHEVVRIPMKQWMLKITDYAERLLQDLDKVDWPEKTKEGQRNWIGKSTGHLVKFSSSDFTVDVFTTRLDTIYGVSFLVLAPEHPLVSKITTSNQKAIVEKYQLDTSKQLEVERKQSATSGVFTGAFAFHPLTNQPIPIWISNYVLGDYGQAAVMGVPAHDQRDFDFANKYSLPILPVIQSSTIPCFEEGVVCNSSLVNGLQSKEAKTKLEKFLIDSNLGGPHTEYKLRDWLFSRQRYWGEPFPLIHFPNQEIKTVPSQELPVLLPEVADYEPSDSNESPLAKIDSWVNYQGGKRETDTMPGSAGSSWYFLRFTDPSNENSPFDFKNQHYWMPVDIYIGGPEHTVGHLLYARFWQKVLFDAGLVSHDEPFKKLAHQGMILGTDGHKISKSRGNTIDLDKIYNDFGADVLRTYICFLGPLDRDKPWSEANIDGVKRFLGRIERLILNNNQLITNEASLDVELEKKLHKTIKEVSEDIENLSFNTAIAKLMSLINAFYEKNCHNTKALEQVLVLLSPFAPHFCEELWEKLGHKDRINQAPWPDFNPALTTNEFSEIGVQINGKTRASITLNIQATEKEALEVALKEENIKAHIAGVSIKKIIYKPNKILNIII